MHLTRCVSFSFCFFKFLIFETAIYANKDAYNGVTRVLDAWQQKHEMRPRWGGKLHGALFLNPRALSPAWVHGRTSPTDGAAGETGAKI